MTPQSSSGWGARRSLATLLRERRGIVSIYLAVVMGTMVLLGVAALDIVRTHLVRSRVMMAADAAILAAGRSLGSDTWDDVGVAFFNANASSGLGGTFTIGTGDFTQTAAGTGLNRVTLTFNASISMLTAGLIDIDALRLSVTSVAEQRAQTAELAMVLDNTGSMLGTNIAALRSDAQTLITTLANGSTNGQLRNVTVAVVPYATTVNPGAVATSLVSGVTRGTASNRWWGCVIEPPSPNTLAIAPPAGANWRAYVAPSTTDNNYADKGYFDDWPVYDPMVALENEVSWGNDSTGPNLGCPRTAITPLTSNIATLTQAVSAMRAWSRGGTSSDIGMAWGLRALAPNGPIATGSAFLGSVPKVIVMMTDGEAGYYKLEYDMSHNKENKDKTVKTDFGGYGRVFSSGDQYGLLGGVTSRAEATTAINTNLRTLCANARTLGVQVYAITFGVTEGSDTETTYKNCASDASYYFAAPSTAELQAAFSTIGGALLELVIVR